MGGVAAAACGESAFSSFAAFSAFFFSSSSLAFALAAANSAFFSFAAESFACFSATAPTAVAAAPTPSSAAITPPGAPSSFLPTLGDATGFLASVLALAFASSFLALSNPPKVPLESPLDPAGASANAAPAAAAIIASPARLSFFCPSALSVCLSMTAILGADVYP